MRALQYPSHPRMLNALHYASENCKLGEARRLCHETLKLWFEVRRVYFQINYDTLLPLEAFP